MGIVDIRKPGVTPRSSPEGDAQASNKRRSARVVIDIQVNVFGQDLSGKIFQEQTTTVTVSIHGCCALMLADIDPQRPALLINSRTGAEVQARVVHRKDVESGRREIGFEFDNAHPRFWGIGFPPDDWDPADRKKPVWTQKPIAPPPLKGGKK